MKNESFEKRAPKMHHIRAFSSVFSVVLVWTIGENVSKSMRFIQSALVWTGENKPKKASVGENILPGFCQDENEYF